MPDADFTDLDRAFMAEAIQLAKRGLGQVEPNPLVGAVVISDGRVVGRGYHPRFGDRHAEIVALDEAGPAASSATLYVTLEPCNHHGKTPPCTERIIASGVKRVVAGMTDPNPLVAGQGFDRLRRAGLDVRIGCLEIEAMELNAPYLKRLRAARPYVHAKWAMSLDGRTSTRAGESKWITGEEARRHAHENLRGRCDGILVGKKTVLADDPLLTARPAGTRVATRVVVDSTASIPLDCQLVRTAREVPTLVATTPSASPEKLDELRSTGCEVVVIQTSANGRVAIDQLLDEMGRRHWTNLLVEGGAEILGAFADLGEIDAAHVYVAPIVLGGASPGGPVQGTGVEKIAQALSLVFDPPIVLGRDLYFSAHRPIFQGAR